MDKNDEGVIVLEDENGKFINMVVVEMVELLGEKYVMLQEEGSSDNVPFIFKFVEGSENDSLESIDDEEHLERIFAIFEEKISGYSPLN